MRRKNSETLHLKQTTEAENSNRDLKCVRSSVKGWYTIYWTHFYKAMPKSCFTALGLTGTPWLFQSTSQDTHFVQHLQQGHLTPSTIRPVILHWTSVTSRDLYLSSVLITLSQSPLNACTYLQPRINLQTVWTQWQLSESIGSRKSPLRVKQCGQQKFVVLQLVVSDPIQQLPMQ